MTRRRLLLALLTVVVGCAPVLETDYKPRALNSTDADRRSHYAPAFTAESRPAKSAGPTVSPLGPG